ncbi:2-(1,2-epoxy-1,2-dihydrophenyl)acetyl-CoA isomerase [Flavobacteriaceae bacterium MAR_2010_72]|nr:2-(1,2-epoxy-1,2-dihydrophenyl)acetyl-CoA isomerase [Flavobacteriaceae bacterium MAR_2010_72]TVZ58802.1 2-(1,2-epoxy-1,2-dihydrophenyl)acetyl-CoA isomerase [Flavobacteriaceae bacterium MAR_2010_105]
MTLGKILLELFIIQNLKYKMSNSILLKIEDNVAYISLNRPEVFNSFNREMALKLQDTLDACEKNSDVRAIVLTGNGKAFCAGQDLKEVTSPELNPGFKKILEEHYNPIITRIRTIEKPIIGAVNGVAAGAGANIALACDVVVAHEKVSFIQAFSLIGLIPDSAGTFFLPRLIGFQKASALAMLGDKVSAEEAERLGMIYKVIPFEHFEEEVQKLATKMAKMPTKALGLIKKSLNQSLTNNLEQQLVLESKYQIEAAGTEDYGEGVSAFVEKRQPTFKGK